MTQRPWRSGACCAIRACCSLLLHLRSQQGRRLPPRNRSASAPAEFQHRFKPGQPFQFELAVSNASRQTVVMHAVVTDFSSTTRRIRRHSTGRIVAAVGRQLDRGRSARSDRPSRRDGEGAELIVTPPAHASGGYCCVVFFESRPEMMDRSSTGEPPVYAKILPGVAPFC